MRYYSSYKKFILLMAPINIALAEQLFSKKDGGIITGWPLFCFLCVVVFFGVLDSECVVLVEDMFIILRMEEIRIQKYYRNVLSSQFYGEFGICVMLDCLERASDLFIYCYAVTRVTEFCRDGRASLS